MAVHFLAERHIGQNLEFTGSIISRYTSNYGS